MSWKHSGFSYGNADCCIFAAYVIEKLTGHDYMANVSYKGQDAAESVIKKHGSFESLVTTILGVDPSLYWCDGDPVMGKVPSVGELMGIKLESNIICLSDTGRLVRVPIRYAVRGWRICHQ
jgi:hypothetical protein